MNCKKKIKSVKSINPLKSMIQIKYDIVMKGHGGLLIVKVWRLRVQYFW